MSEIEAASGLLVLDKPAGVTSYDCVRRVKHILHETKVGHCGTLDPLAQGVLIVLFGRETRRQEDFLALEKQYWFRAEFGRLTETGDREGSVTETRDVAGLTRERVEAALKGFLGDQQQVPPRFAALKYRGRRYSDWAREGVEIPRSARPVHIDSFELLAFNPPFWEARVVCSRGTYIRSLVVDVAERLGTVATLDSLVRERIGPYRRGEAIGWETLRGMQREQLLGMTHAQISPHTRNL